MITVMLDNDISGYRDRLAGTLRSTGWEDYNLVQFVMMTEVRLATNSNDRAVWRFCQSNGFILLTANRNEDEDNSLGQTLQEENTDASLPVITVADKNRLAESDYRERCIHAIVTIVFDLHIFLGTGRHYVP